MSNKIYTTEITRFDGGMTDNPRVQSPNLCQYEENFDLGNYPYELKPQYIFTQNAGSFNKTWGIRNMFLASNGVLIGLGVNGSGLPGTYGSSFPWISTSWSGGTSFAAAGALLTIMKLFCEYQGYWYNYHGSGLVGRGILAANATYNAWGTTSTAYSNATNGIIGSNQFTGLEALYFVGSTLGTACDLLLIDGSTTTLPVVLSLPVDFTPTQLVKYGNYLGIVGYRNGANAIMYLWDYVSDDVSEVINLGVGFPFGAGNIGNEVIIFLQSTGGEKISILGYSGGTPNVLDVIKAPTNTSAPPWTNITITSDAVVYQNQIYIGVAFSAPLSSRFVEGGIIRFGKLDEKYPYSYSIAQTFLTTDTPSQNTDGIVCFVFNTSGGNSGQVAALNQNGTNTIYWEQSIPASYLNQSSFYKSQIWNGGDISKQKLLYGIAVDFVALTSGQSVSIGYLKDAETTFTTIFTDNTVGDVTHHSLTIESTGNPLPHFNEITFALTSTAGAIITGFKFLYTIEANKLGLN